MYIDKTAVENLKAVLINAQGGGEGGGAALAAAAQQALDTANTEDFDTLIKRVREMGEALTDEDGSNDREHDTAYAVFEAAQALAPELVTLNDETEGLATCSWCNEPIPADAPYYEAEGRQCCEGCRRSADRHGTPFAVNRPDRDTKLFETVPMYEIVDRDGHAVSERYLDYADARNNMDRGERIARAVYTKGTEPELVEE